MKCPTCGSEVRPSKKYPGYYLCDTCRKRYPESSVLSSEETPEVSRLEAARSRPADSHSEVHRSRPADSRAKARSSRPADSRPEVRPGKSPSSSLRHRRKKKKNPLPFIVAGLIFLAVIGIIIASVSKLTGGSGKKTGSNDKPAPGTVNDTPVKNNNYKVGDIAKLGDISLQVIGYDESKGDEWAAPREGNLFLFINMEIHNNTEEDLTVSSMASFESYCGDYKLDYSSNAFTALATNTDKQQMDGSIAPGKALNGYLCLEVPTDWTSVEVQYSSNVWSDQKITFEITK